MIAAITAAGTPDMPGPPHDRPLPAMPAPPLPDRRTTEGQYRSGAPETRPSDQRRAPRRVQAQLALDAGPQPLLQLVCRQRPSPTGSARLLAAGGNLAEGVVYAMRPFGWWLVEMEEVREAKSDS